MQDDLKIGHINKNSFTENKIILENHQEAFKHMAKLHSIKMKLETRLKVTAKN